MASLQGDVAFITGAASGFGLALTKELVSKGVAIAQRADTTSWEQQYAAYEAGKKIFGRIDYCDSFYPTHLLLIHRPWLPNFNPSTARDRSIIKPDIVTLSINLIGQLYTAALALQVFERQTQNRHGFKGKLLMTASVYGFFPSAIMAMYASSKAAIVNYTRSTALIYAGKGITVNAIAPSMARKNF
ncbi:hypothetical protein DFH05DRAFT_1535950 [Lentinula detonsa]|uniref:NAD(P)-binding protein n=1 Tax=Lentinula detonsa TaxID=2804962 RepID=A0A9W8TX54_9AGAR|nr:hypothetical protein DFH05DRAFT_1535950 [Lentinula detonsa]